MRLLLIAVLASAWFAIPANAARISTGQDLVQACTDYLARVKAQADLDNNAARAPHPCRSFLQGFFASLIKREEARQQALVNGLPYASKERCVRLPDQLTYVDMAGRLIAFAKAYPPTLQGPAATLAQMTVERDFPCPPPAR